MLSSDVLNPQVIRQMLHLSQERMSHLLHVSTKTLWRWENTSTAPNSVALQHLSKLKQIASLASKVYTPEGIETFLFTPIEEFDFLTAYDMIALGKHEQVLGALAADYEGLGY
ncbi:DNA-binding transcriptional regulator [Chroococcus sp. FPU101]|uniref:helix-turn-helix domain-containing protein n=1 Tax=Chroococcus sp. FPU101 TaxID=1974212 RepID=UPI001A900565|nr:transcriptional regulator [Chroococcus sp. FPU101]GFE68456.1 unknown protein [Chroococcus sp. FPU101]